LTIPHPDGELRVRRVLSGRSRAEVVRRLEILKDEARGGFPSGQSTGAYLARWIDHARPRLRPATYQGYARHVRLHLRPLAEIPLGSLTPGHVERLLAGIVASGRSPRTAVHVRAVLRRALADGVRDGLIGRNVAALARPPRVVRREMRPLSASEVRELLETTADDEYGPLWALAVGSGLRLGEILGLSWNDVDLEAGRLVVRRAMARADEGWALAEPKTARSRRTVELPAMAREALGARRTRQEADRTAAGSAWQDRGLELVFTDTVGRPLTPAIVSDAWRRTRRRLGLGVRFHDLRHTYASLLLGAGVPLKVVSDALGHSTIALTADTYAHLTPELRREAADAMDRALADG
jgi:integrase